jgi:2-C-methyl-D-erythritol 4-phosphate cytidylyltransferase
MGSDLNKLLLTLHGKPLLAWTLLAAMQSRAIIWIGIMAQPEDFDGIATIYHCAINALKPGANHPARRRNQTKSVYNGYKPTRGGPDGFNSTMGGALFSHPELFDRRAAALATCQGFIAAIPVKDTIKIVDSKGWIEDTPIARGCGQLKRPRVFR